jgi:hypothetical protein
VGPPCGEALEQTALEDEHREEQTVVGDEQRGVRVLERIVDVKSARHERELRVGLRRPTAGLVELVEQVEGACASAGARARAGGEQREEVGVVLCREERRVDGERVARRSIEALDVAVELCEPGGEDVRACWRQRESERVGDQRPSVLNGLGVDAEGELVVEERVGGVGIGEVGDVHDHTAGGPASSAIDRTVPSPTNTNQSTSTSARSAWAAHIARQSASSSSSAMAGPRRRRVASTTRSMSSPWASRRI